MGLFSFIKDAGEKLFGIKVAAAAQAAEDAGAQAAQAITEYIAQQNLGLSNLGVVFADGRVTLTGAALFAGSGGKGRARRRERGRRDRSR